ncbi:hypothetical protein, partial [uncultured Campylobacter sp.]|uniref:hypothetical protein n=1 Tax=uncultured Campylobacter sp. TaxID=218934 RepID=UPI002617AF02
ASLFFYFYLTFCVLFLFLNLFCRQIYGSFIYFYFQKNHRNFAVKFTVSQSQANLTPNKPSNFTVFDFQNLSQIYRRSRKFSSNFTRCPS